MKKVLLSVALICAASASMAKTVYDCDMKRVSLSGWVTDRYIFTYDEETQAGTVLDGLIKHYHDKPFAAAVTPSDTRLDFRWTLRNLKTAEGDSLGRLVFRAVVMKKSKKLRIKAVVAGYDNRPSGEGVCTKVE